MEEEETENDRGKVVREGMRERKRGRKRKQKQNVLCKLWRYSLIGTSIYTYIKMREYAIRGYAHAHKDTDMTDVNRED